MVIVVIWRRLLFPCEDNWLYFGVWLISFISVPLLLYYLLKSNNVDEIRWFWTLIAILFLSVYSFYSDNNIALNEIKKNGGVVKPAVIYKRYSSIKTSESISINYDVGGKRVSAKYNCSKDVYNRLFVGDTILVIYSLRCSEWNLPFNYFPTIEEIQQCKNGSLLRNGKLIIIE